MTDTPTDPTQWWDYQPSDGCQNLDWVNEWLTAVQTAICDCFEACGIPVPDTKCVSVCPPANDGLLAAKGCCQRIDVWRGATTTRYQSGACDDPVPSLQVTARVLRCTVDWKACTDEAREGINAAILREQAILAEHLPRKLAQQSCCNGGLVTQAVTVTPVCDPCVGSQVTFTLQRPT